MKCITEGCENLTTLIRCPACLRAADEAWAKHQGTPLPGSPVSKRKKPERKEDAVRMAIKQWYRLHGAGVWDTEQGWRNPKCRNCGHETSHGTSRVDKGMPDLIILVPGKGVRFIETKSDTGRQTPEQKIFEQTCIEAGGTYLLVRSLDEIIEYERQHGAGAH